MWKDFDLHINFKIFKELYKDATVKDESQKGYKFLYVDVRKSIFRRNFDHEYKIKSSSII